MKVQELRDELASRGMEAAGLKGALETSVPKVAKEGDSKEVGEVKKDMEIDMNEQAAVEKMDVEKTANVTPSTENLGEVGAETGADAKPVSAVVDATNGTAEEASVVPSEPAAQGASCKPVTTDLERKQKRAERFGLELMVSEVDKRRLRAARFGSSPTNGTDKVSEKTSTNQEVSKMSPTVKEMEAVKRKARAARFGIEEIVPVTVAAPGSHDDAKKKARLARFGLKVKLSPQEQEKKKLRAARFGLDGASETQVESANKVAVAPPATS